MSPAVSAALNTESGGKAGKWKENDMAGYDGFSQSNNAVDAENAGLLTASGIVRRIGHGATAAGVMIRPERTFPLNDNY